MSKDSGSAGRSPRIREGQTFAGQGPITATFTKFGAAIANVMSGKATKAEIALVKEAAKTGSKGTQKTAKAALRMGGVK